MEKKNELVKKTKKMNPKKIPRVSASLKCHYYPIFCKELQNMQSVTSVTLDGWPNSSILASPYLNLLVFRDRE